VYAILLMCIRERGVGMVGEVELVASLPLVRAEI
jgi:hypothetical protein